MDVFILWPVQVGVKRPLQNKTVKNSCTVGLDLVCHRSAGLSLIYNQAKLDNERLQFTCHHHFNMIL